MFSNKDISKASPTRELSTVSTESQERLKERVEGLAIALAMNSPPNKMITSAAEASKESPSCSHHYLSFSDIITSGGAYNTSEEENETGDEHSQENDSYYKSLLSAGAETINDSYKEKPVLFITNGETGVSNKLPTDYHDLSKLITCQEAIPDENDQCYYCRVCQQRSESKSMYYQHLRDYHQMSLKSQENWRLNDPEIIPTECDTSYCCIQCQKVHSDEKPYWEHLKKQHHTYIVNHTPFRRQARKAVVFNRNLDDDVRLARIEMDKRNIGYTCIICQVTRSSLVNISHHYFLEHSVLAEFHRPPVKPKVHSSSSTASVRSLIVPTQMDALANHSHPDTINDNNKSSNSLPVSKETIEEDKDISKSSPVGILDTDLKRGYCILCSESHENGKNLMNHFKTAHAQYEFVCRACKSRPLRSGKLLYHFSKTHDGMGLSSAPLQMLTPQGTHPGQMGLQVKRHASLLKPQDPKTRSSQRTAQDKENQSQQSKRIEDIMAHYTKQSTRNPTNDDSRIKLATTSSQSFFEEPYQSFFDEPSNESPFLEDDMDLSCSEFSVVNEPATVCNSDSTLADISKCDEEGTSRLHLSTLMGKFIEGELEMVCRSCDMSFSNRFACLMHFVQYHKVPCTTHTEQEDMLDCTGCQTVTLDPKPESKPESAVEKSKEVSNHTVPVVSNLDSRDDYFTLYGYIAAFMKPVELTTCPYCQYVLPLAQSNHQCPVKGRIEHQALTSVSRCAVCFKGFDSLAELQEHKVKLHKQDCKVCGESFATSYTLNQHIRESQHTVVTVRCILCREWTDDVFAHLYEIHNKEIQCRTCEIKTSNILKHHLDLHTNSSSYNCTVCFNGYPSPRALKKHDQKRHTSPLCALGDTERKRKEVDEPDQVLDLCKRRKYNDLGKEVEGAPTSSTLTCEEVTTSKGIWDPGTSVSQENKENSPGGQEVKDTAKRPKDDMLSRKLDDKNRGDYSVLYGHVASNMKSMVHATCPFCEESLTPNELYHKCLIKGYVKQDLLASVSRCSVCLKGFDCLVDLRNHKALFHKRDCKVCGESFKNQYILNQHVRDKQHVVATVRCIICNDWTDDIFGHLFDIHDKAVQCDTCNKISSNILQHFYDDHRSSVTKNCSICFHGFNNQELLDSHYKENHTNNHCNTSSLLHASASANNRLQSILVKIKKPLKRKRSIQLRFSAEVTEIDQADAVAKMTKRRRFY